MDESLDDLPNLINDFESSHVSQLRSLTFFLTYNTLWSFFKFWIRYISMEIGSSSCSQSSDKWDWFIESTGWNFFDCLVLNSINKWMLLIVCLSHGNSTLIAYCDSWFGMWNDAPWPSNNGSFLSTLSNIRLCFHWFCDSVYKTTLILIWGHADIILEIELWSLTELFGDEFLWCTWGVLGIWYPR